MEVNKFLFWIIFFLIYPFYKFYHMKWKRDETMDQMAKLCNASETSSYISSRTHNHPKIFLEKMF